jgi:hypothetical protein
MEGEMTRVHSSIVVSNLILLFLVLVSSGSAATLSIPNTSVPVGTATVQIPINVDDGTGIAGQQFTVTFDPAVLQPTSAVKGTLDPGAEWYLLFNTNVSGQISVGAYSLNGTPQIIPIPSGAGSLARINFNVLGGLGSSTNLTFTFFKIVDITASEISSITSPGTFTVVSATPNITQINPASGPVGTEVTIDGTNFGTSQGTSVVKFNGSSATTYNSWSDTQVKCLVPTGATTGPVTVTTAAGPSNGMTFTVTIPTINYDLNVSVNPGAGGTVKDVGTNGLAINCPVDCFEIYASGAPVNLTATATTGYKFVNWTGCDTPSGANCSMNMTSTKTVTANFALNNLVTVPAAAGGGSIQLTTSSPGCGFSNVSVSVESQVGTDPEYDYPYGLVGFTVNCSAADVAITYTAAGDLTGTPYRKYGPTTPGNPATTQWYTFSNVTIVGNTVTLHLFDGVIGDDTAVDLRIVDQGGIAQPAQQQPMAAIPTMTEWGMGIMVMLLQVSGVYLMRRKRIT